MVLKNKRPTWCHLLFYFTSYVLNMFRLLIYPSSGACDYSVELPHWSYCSVKTSLQNNTTNVVIQQNSRKLQMMDVLIYETCWARKNWNKIASDIKLVFYSSTITTTHGPINIKYGLFAQFHVALGVNITSFGNALKKMISSLSL